jgi:tetratricopeptide (TPR) repeat protein
VVKSASTNPGAAQHQIQRLREMWLKEGRHYAVKTPEDNHDGYVYILREGSAYAAWLSVRGKDEQQKPAAEFVKYILQKAEEAGIPDAEHRVKQFVLELIDILATAGERYRRDALKAVSTVEKALRATAFAGLSATALYSVYSGLYSEAVVSSVASAIALAEVGQFRKAVQYLQKAAKALYEAARDVFERVKVTVQRLVELFVEAVTQMLAWIDEHKAYLFLMTAVAAGAVALSVALNLWGLVELEKFTT